MQMSKVPIISGYGQIRLLIILLQNRKPWRAVQITTNNDKLTTT